MRQPQFQSEKQSRPIAYKGWPRITISIDDFEKLLGVR
jgi:hypothetical protein